MEDLRRLVEVLLRLRLVAQNAMRQIRDIHSAQRVDRMRQQLRMPFRVVEIGNRGLHKPRPARAQIGSHSGQLLRIPRHQKQARALRRPDPAGRLGDPRGRAKNQNLPATVP